jgi:hypothetical protein
LEKEKKLKLMKFWIFGTFLIIIVAATIYVGVALGTGTAIFGQLYYWLAVVASAVLCVLFYFGYSKFLDRKE